MYGVAGVLPSLNPPAPPPAPDPPPPPATTIYETLLLAGVGAESTMKFPVVVNVCILKSPDVVTHPPVATIKLGTPETLEVESCTFFQPLVPST